MKIYIWCSINLKLYPETVSLSLQKLPVFSKTWSFWTNSSKFSESLQVNFRWSEYGFWQTRSFSVLRSHLSLSNILNVHQTTFGDLPQHTYSNGFLHRISRNFTENIKELCTEYQGICVSFKIMWDVQYVQICTMDSHTLSWKEFIQ